MDILENEIEVLTGFDRETRADGGHGKDLKTLPG